MPSSPLHASIPGLCVASVLAIAGCREDAGRASLSPQTSSSAAGGEGGSAAGESGSGGGSLSPGEPLAVLNWNTRNFFNDKNDSATADEIVLSAAGYREKREVIAAVIRELDPDIAVLQEVENLSVLEDLNRIDLGGAYPHVALVEGNDPRGIDIGALSKLPLDEVVSHRTEGFAMEGTQGPVYRYARDCIELHLSHGGRRIVLLGVHFLSKAMPQNDDKRLAEAQHTRVIADAITEADPSAAIAVLGDFNDEPRSPAFSAIAGSGEAAFEDVAESAPAADRWTFEFNGALKLIDHQMVNPVLRRMLDTSTVKISHGAVIDDASDHAPILATYKIAPPR